LSSPVSFETPSRLAPRHCGHSPPVCAGATTAAHKMTAAPNTDVKRMLLISDISFSVPSLFEVSDEGL
jgi:hypothetical protein